MIEPAYLKQLQPTSPGGCQSSKIKEALEDFLGSRHRATRNACLSRLRDYARTEKLPAEFWPRALERLFQAPRDEAINRYTVYRRWVEVRRQSLRYRNRKGTILLSLSRFMRDRGVIDWTFPDPHSSTSEVAWHGCNPMFRAKVQEWMEILRLRNYSRFSVRCSQTCLRRLGEYLNERGIDYWVVDEAKAAEWMRSLKTSGRWSDRTIRAIVYKAKLFYHWLSRRKELEENPFEELGPFKASKKLPVFLTESEALACIRHARGRLERAVIEFLYATGCRGAELASLDLADLSLESRSIKCIGKGRRERMLIFNRATEEALKSYLPLSAT